MQDALQDIVLYGNITQPASVPDGIGIPCCAEYMYYSALPDAPWGPLSRAASVHSRARL